MSNNIINTNNKFGSSDYPLTYNEQRDPGVKDSLGNGFNVKSKNNSESISSGILHPRLNVGENNEPTFKQIGVESNIQPARAENIGKYCQSDEVQDRLTSNIEKTADNFLNQFKLENQIGKKFKAQLESLRECYYCLQANVKTFEKWEGESKQITLAKSIVKINDLVCRLNNDSVGGINKLQKSDFHSSTMCVLKEAKQYEKAKKDAKSENPALKKLGKQQKERLEKNAYLSKKVVEENLDALNKNLKILEKFSESPKGGNNIEKMLNLIQQCCLNAWVFNDVAKELKKTGYYEEDTIKRLGVWSEDNEKMRKLNDAARNTTMFADRSINELLKDANLDKVEMSKEESVGKFIEKWGEIAVGFRGRCGIDKNQNREPSKSIGNTKNEKGVVVQNGSLFDKFNGDEAHTAAIKGSVVPPETANLKTVPDEMLKDLKDILNTKGGQAIAQLLKEKGFVESHVTYVNGVLGISDLEAKPSFASFINDFGLPTYCSVSGTTGEIVSVLHCTLKDKNGESPLAKVFDNLLEIAEGNWPKPPPDFSTYFAPVATFMEVGHFHTTGEVLGGFLSVAVADRNVRKEEEIRLYGGDKKEIEKKIEESKIDADKRRFRNLLSYFNSHQENFLGFLAGETVLN